MKARSGLKIKNRTLTLAEWLLIVALVLIIVTIILKPFPPFYHPGYPHKSRAQLETAQLVNAIEAYEAVYDCLPLTGKKINADITCGINPVEIQAFQQVAGTRLLSTNSDLLLVLMDFDSGINAGHKLNPQKIKFLSAKLVQNTNSPGVSIVDHQFRDPWGNPYIISLDANQDGRVQDAIYSCSGLFSNHTPTSLTNNNGIYAWHGNVMVWSRGSDGKVSMAVQSNKGVNKDNVVSWE